MGPEAIALAVTGDAGEGIYSFVCPGCTDQVEKQADRKIVALLVSAGVSLVDGPEVTTVTPVPDPEERREGPALTLDDLIQFHFQLQDDDYLQRFLVGS